MGIHELGFSSKFARMCAKACERGWHEANGGNLSYLLDDADIEACGTCLSQEGIYTVLAHSVPILGGKFVMITASGAYLENAEDDLAETAGIIALSDDGSSWRIAWGFSGEARPSSELETHLAAYAADSQATGGTCRVVYHAHGPHVIALSAVLEPDTCVWTRMLWKIMSESIIVFPEGLGVVSWMVPGSPELAQATVELMRSYKACVWANHGIMARAASFDEAFGIIDTIEKAAAAYLQACSACGGAKPKYLVSDEQLLAICERYGISANEALLVDAR